MSNQMNHQVNIKMKIEIRTGIKIAIQRKAKINIKLGFFLEKRLFFLHVTFSLERWRQKLGSAPRDFEFSIFSWGVKISRFPNISAPTTGGQENNDA